MMKLLHAAAIIFWVIPISALAQKYDPETRTIVLTGLKYGKAMSAYSDGDFITSLREWKSYADEGSIVALSMVGKFYLKGEGVPQDYTEAAKWFMLAAEKGSPFAQAQLGVMSHEGKGVSQSDINAVNWLNLAAQQGDLPGQVGLGLLYFQGNDDIKDYVLAHMWLNIASTNKSKSAAGFRDRVETLMTNDQIAEAQLRAGVCMASKYQDC